MFNFRKNIPYFVLILLLFCSSELTNAQQRTSKSKTKNGKSSKSHNAYQDMTTRYNGYFNAKMLMIQNIEQLKTKYKDDFDAETLNILAFDDSSSGGGDMETILKKASTAIQKHPNAKWVDDCYLLMGQAHFFKGDYEEAVKTFQFINKRFKKNVRKTDYQKKATNKRSQEDRVKVNIAGFEEKSDFDKEERIKENEKKKQAIAESQKEKEQAATDRRKDKEQQMKERAKAKKELAKERAKIKKQKAIERKRKLKWREKNRKRKMKGKPALPYEPKYTFDKKDDKTDKEEIKEIETIEESKEDKSQETETATEETGETVEEEVTESEEEEEATSNFILKQDSSTSDEKAVQYNDRFFSFLYHEPAKYESVVWLARSYMASENTGDAIQSLDYIKQDRNMPRKHRADLNALYAQYHLDKDQTQEAYNYLSLAIAESRNKPQKARYHYIQSQLSEQNEDYKANVASLKKVLKNRPSYEMGFNTKLEIARNQIKSGDKSVKESIRYLEKMLKDDKNFDNQDQIYMAMADIAIEDANIEDALAYLKKATDNSTVNNDVKAKAYLKIAEVYYEREDYLLSSAYYDSSLVILPKTFPNYDDIAIRKDVLAELAGHINTVELQDSLLHLVSLPEALRNDIIDELIDKIEEQAQADMEAESVKELAENDNNGNNNNNSGGTFYFYSANAKSMGKIDFVREWGDRPDVDNWRRSAAITTLESSVADTDEADLKTLALGGQLSRDMFTNALPFSTEAKAAANATIEKALFEIGTIYAEKLTANDKAIENFETLLNRFPKTQKAPETHYALWQLYTAEKNMAQAKIHKNWLDENAADNELTKIANGATPTEDKEKEALLVFYEKTYQLYEKEKYKEVLSRKKQAETKFASNTLQPEFDLLEAFVIGSTKDKKNYISALEAVSKKHKGTDVQLKADEILSFLDTNKLKNKEAASKYKFDQKAPHYHLLVMDGYTQNITKAINNVSDHNRINHTSDKLKVTQMLLDKESPIILIKTFSNKAKSDLYTKSVKTAIADIMKSVEVPYQSFAISKGNFNTFFKDKNVEAYLQFYKENYE